MNQEIYKQLSRKKLHSSFPNIYLFSIYCESIAILYTFLFINIVEKKLILITSIKIETFSFLNVI